MDAQEPAAIRRLTRRLVVTALLLVVLLLCGLWMRSHHTFDYWTSPDFLKEHHRLSIGCAWGRLMIAYGWPSAVSKWWKPNSEPVFGNEPDLAPGEQALPEERLDLARQQFGFQIDGVAVPVNYPFVTIPIWVIVATLLAVVALLIFPDLRSRCASTMNDPFNTATRFINGRRSSEP